MKFTELYNETIAVWPSSLEVSGENLKKDGSGAIPELVEAWENAEIATEEWSEWHQLMVWAIYGGYRRLAIRSIAEGKTNIIATDIDLNLVQNTFKENLFTRVEPSYSEDMKQSYENDLKP